MFDSISMILYRMDQYGVCLRLCSLIAAVKQMEDVIITVSIKEVSYADYVVQHAGDRMDVDKAAGTNVDNPTNLPSPQPPTPQHHSNPSAWCKCRLCQIMLP